ncbi:unnamed protein product [Linum trigynum]|uniref:Uncharacterized protein n=1 Tax=Linum trigynum TaxID=586398 RepID=A0AAV2GPD2_9ROSI
MGGAPPGNEEPRNGVTEMAPPARKKMKEELSADEEKWDGGDSRPQATLGRATKRPEELGRATVRIVGLLSGRSDGLAFGPRSVGCGEQLQLVHLARD